MHRLYHKGKSQTCQLVMTLCLYLIPAFSYIVLVKEKHKDIADNLKINRKGEIGIKYLQI
jgi:hypothetical protein